MFCCTPIGISRISCTIKIDTQGCGAGLADTKLSLLMASYYLHLHSSGWLSMSRFTHIYNNNTFLLLSTRLGIQETIYHLSHYMLPFIQPKINELFILSWVAIKMGIGGGREGEGPTTTCTVLLNMEQGWGTYTCMLYTAMINITKKRYTFWCSACYHGEWKCNTKPNCRETFPACTTFKDTNGQMTSSCPRGEWCKVQIPGIPSEGIPDVAVCVSNTPPSKFFFLCAFKL